MTLLRRQVKDQAQFLSPNSGRSYPGNTLSDILPEVLEDIFQHRLLHGQAISSALPQPLGAHVGAQVTTISVFGPAGAERSLKRAAAEHGLENIQIEPMMQISSNEQPQGAVAVVGYAGKLPACQDLEGFWDTLIKARDVHKKVSQYYFCTIACFHPRLIREHRCPKIGSTGSSIVTRQEITGIAPCRLLAAFWTNRGPLTIDSSTCRLVKRFKRTPVSDYS